MTNREFMQTLCDADFEEAMHQIYFGGYIGRKGSTPQPRDIIPWLSDFVDPDSDFWQALNVESNKHTTDSSTSNICNYDPDGWYE